MTNAAAFIEAFHAAWHAGDVAEKTALLATNARGKLAGQLQPEVLDNVANNPAFAPLFQHGFEVTAVQEIPGSARAELLVHAANEAVPYVLSMKHDGTSWGITGLQLERTDF